MNRILGDYNVIAPSYLNFDKDNFVSFEENDAMVRCKSSLFAIPCRSKCWNNTMRIANR